MSFLTGLIESPEEERARLAAAPEGSRSHALAPLPVRITHGVEGRLIELPRPDSDLSIVVVPVTPHPERLPEPRDGEPRPKIRRHSGWWDCIVVGSNDPSYPVGGHRLAIPEAELVRGRKCAAVALECE